MVKALLFLCLLHLIDAQKNTQRYSAKDCKNGNKIRDIGLNPTEFRRKGKVVFQQGEENLHAWHERHYAKFDPSFVKVSSLILEEGETLVPHLFISEEHVMQCADSNGVEIFRFVQEVQAQNIILTGFNSAQVDLELAKAGFEVIEADVDAMSVSEYMEFEATNKSMFKRRKNQRDGGVQRRDGKIAPPPPPQTNSTDEL